MLWHVPVSFKQAGEGGSGCGSVGRAGGVLTTSSQAGLSAHAAMPRLVGTQGLVPVGRSPGGWAHPVLLLRLGACKQERGFLPKGLVRAPPVSPGLHWGNPGWEDSLWHPPATH